MTITTISRQKPAVFLALMAVALQLQLTLFGHGDYPGLRVTLADMLLPSAGLWIGYTLFTKKSLWPRWSFKKPYFWLAGMFLVMTIAMVNGYYANGSLSNWAFVNKYIGFIILLCYFLLGGWVAANFEIDYRAAFTRPLVLFYIFVLTASFLCALVQPLVPLDLWLSGFPWDGFMVNRNAFAVFGVFILILLEVGRGDQKINIPEWIYALFWTLMPTFAIYNGSRIAWIGGAIILGVVLLKRPLTTIRKILPFLLIGSLFAFLIHHYTNEAYVKNNMQLKYLVDLIEPEQDAHMYYGDEKRLISYHDGLKLYEQSNPVIGAGLGTYREFQKGKRGKFIDIIDFTALWLLVETGLLGLLTFSAFFLLITRTVYKKAYALDSSFHKSVFFFLIFFACASFLHELMYTRFLWFALGLCVVTPLYKTGVSDDRAQ